MEDTVKTDLKELIENILITNIKDQRKIHNQKYYAKHRLERLEKIKIKMECTLCHKQVSTSNMNRHMKGSNCVNKDCIRKKKVSEIESLKNQITELKSKMLLKDE
jgi:septin family protein